MLLSKSTRNEQDHIINTKKNFKVIKLSHSVARAFGACASNQKILFFFFGETQFTFLSGSHNFAMFGVCICVEREKLEIFSILSSFSFLHLVRQKLTMKKQPLII